MNYAYKTIPGRRELNEDNCCVHVFEDGTVLAAVADGMGGHAAGDVASRMLIDGLVAALQEQDLQTDLARTLRRALRNCNLSIFRYAEGNQGCKGMGTTLVCAVLQGRHATVLNVGDSRLYHLHDSVLHRITKDHSLVQTLIDEGAITEEEASVHPMRNIITRSVGSGLYVDVDIFEFDLSDNEQLLLCSDGLHGSLADDMLRAILQHSSDPEEACEDLIDAAYSAGSRDNITALVASFPKEVTA